MTEPTNAPPDASASLAGYDIDTNASSADELLGHLAADVQREQAAAMQRIRETFSEASPVVQKCRHVAEQFRESHQAAARQHRAELDDLNAQGYDKEVKKHYRDKISTVHAERVALAESNFTKDLEFHSAEWTKRHVEQFLPMLDATTSAQGQFINSSFDRMLPEEFERQALVMLKRARTAPVMEDRVRANQLLESAYLGLLDRRVTQPENFAKGRTGNAAKVRDLIQTHLDTLLERGHFRVAQQVTQKFRNSVPTLRNMMRENGGWDDLFANTVLPELFPKREVAK